MFQFCPLFIQQIDFKEQNAFLILDIDLDQWRRNLQIRSPGDDKQRQEDTKWQKGVEGANETKWVSERSGCSNGIQYEIEEDNQNSRYS